jgi:hypothetical protein
MSTIKRFEDLDAWKESRLLNKKIGSEDYIADVKKFNDLSTFKQNVMDFSKTVSSFS